MIILYSAIKPLFFGYRIGSPMTESPRRRISGIETFQNQAFPSFFQMLKEVLVRKWIYRFLVNMDIWNFASSFLMRSNEILKANSLTSSVSRHRSPVLSEVEASSPKSEEYSCTGRIVHNQINYSLINPFQLISLSNTGTSSITNTAASFLFSVFSGENSPLNLAVSQTPFILLKSRSGSISCKIFKSRFAVR